MNRRPPRRFAASLAIATTLAATAVVFPARAALTGPGVGAGHNITVFHNIDFVAVFGYPVGDRVTIDVLRGGHRVASASGAVVDTPEGGGLEVNHGPEGAPAPGDCWESFTPDVRPGDRIQVRHGATTEEVTVDDITFSGPPTLTGPPLSGEDPPADTVELRGRALTIDAEGNAVPIVSARLDSGEVRTVSRVRAAPTSVVDDPAVVGGFVMRYEPPGYGVFRNLGGLSQTEIRDEILDPGAGHAAGFGHVPPPLPPESMLVDGIDDVHGPALGCEASPAAVNAVGTRSVAAVNVAALAAAPGAGDPVVTFAGPAAPDVSAVSVTLSDGTTTTSPVAGTLAASVPGGHQGWSATFRRAHVASLADGVLTATARFISPDAPDGVAGQPMTVIKDVVAPTLASDPAPGTYEGPLDVRLVSGGARVTTYRTDGGPAGPDDSRYLGVPITLQPGSRTITALAIDSAGNETRERLPFTVTAPPSPPGPAPATTPERGHETVAAFNPSSSLVAAAGTGSGLGALPRLRLTRLAVPARIRRASARRNGVALIAGVRAGTSSLAIELLRRTRSGKLVRLTRVVRATRTAGSTRIRLRARTVRRALTVGRYVVRVTPRKGSLIVGERSDASLRVTR